MFKGLLFLLCFISFGSCAENVRLNVGFGNEDVTLSSDLDDRVKNAGENSVITSIHFGYVLPANFTIDIGYGFLTNDVWWDKNDNIHLNTYEVLLGYLIEIGPFYIEPKVGYAKWELDLEQSELFNPGTEYKFDGSGSDPFAMLTAGIRFTSVYGMSVSYKYFDFEYGEADSYILGFDFRF